MSYELMTLREDEFIGYTLHYASPRDLDRVATHLAVKASSGGRYDVTRFSDFIFVRANQKTTKNAVRCLLRMQT